MDGFFLFYGLPWPVVVLFTIALLIVLIGHGWAVILFVTGGKVAATAVEPNDELTDSFHWIFLVPALNEEVTIADSVSRLREVQARHRTIMVIDDGSTDRTPEVLASIAGPDLEVMRRDLPNAQLGKAAALNAAWRHIRDDVLARPEFVEVSEDKVVLVIVDADGRLDPTAPAYLATHLQDPQVGGVQVSVRIYNRYNPLTWMQDIEFGVYGGLYQLGRTHWGTAGMGGNGQANRLSALNSVVTDSADGPWNHTLTEDQDIGLHLMRNGWRGHHEVRTTVAQQGVSDIKRLYKQRTRWSQGNIQAMHHLRGIGEVKASPIAKLDLVWALLQPPLQAFIGLSTIVALLCAVVLNTPFIAGNSQWAWLWLLFLFFLAFGGTAIGCLAAGRGNGFMGYVRGLATAIPYAFYSWILWPVIV
ncbi:MAG: glycosyltransferase family 2 protein, partial [Candidatus Nanopelagicales bacterium]